MAESPVEAPTPPSLTSTHVWEVEKEWFTAWAGICGSKANNTSYRTVRQPLVVRTERSIGNGPLAVWIYNSFVVFPIVRIRSVVHPHFEILCAREEEVPVFWKLTRITPRVVVNDCVRIRWWYHSLFKLVGNGGGLNRACGASHHTCDIALAVLVDWPLPVPSSRLISFLPSLVFLFLVMSR